MQPGKKISKLLSIVLIVLLMQKMGGGLYLHTWLHCQKEVATTSTVPVISTAGYNCNCIDDFCTPFSETQPTVLQELPAVKPDFVIFNTTSVSLSSKVFHSLRAPPFIS